MDTAMTAAVIAANLVESGKRTLTETASEIPQEVKMIGDVPDRSKRLNGIKERKESYHREQAPISPDSEIMDGIHLKVRRNRN